MLPDFHPPRFTGLGQFDPYILTLEEQANRSWAGKMLCIFKQFRQGRAGARGHDVEGLPRRFLDPLVAHGNAKLQPVGGGAQEVRFLPCGFEQRHRHLPLQCEFFALEGLSQLLKTIELVRANLNPSLEIQGIMLTMFDKRNKLSDQVAADVRQNMGAMVYNTMIPRNVRVSEAPSHGLPALVYDLRCPGSQAYIKLAGELIQRERMRAAA